INNYPTRRARKNHRQIAIAITLGTDPISDLGGFGRAPTGQAVRSNSALAPAPPSLACGVSASILHAIRCLPIAIGHSSGEARSGWEMATVRSKAIVACTYKCPVLDRPI